MFRAVIVAIALLISAVSAQAQLSNNQTGNLSGRGITTIDLAKAKPGIKPLAEGDLFISPQDSLLKLQRQVGLEMLPAGFIPSQETETSSFRRKALRYGVAYYRDSIVPGFTDFRDVMLGLRFDTRDGVLIVTYFHVAIIIDPSRIQYQEDRPSMAVLADGDATVLLSLFDGNKQELVSFTGLYSESPHPVNFIGGDDVDGVKSDVSVGKFAVFVRGGASRATLFLLLTDPGLKDIESFELLKDLASTDQAFIFEILPAATTTFRAAGVTAPPK